MEKAISIDLDGTLLYQNREIPERTVKYLNNLIEKGYFLILCSGRPYRSMLKYAQLFPANTPIISENGAYIGTLDKSYERELKRFSKSTFLDMFVANKEIIKHGYFSVGHYAYIYNRIAKLEPFYHIGPDTVVVNGPYDMVKNLEAPNGCMFVINAERRLEFEEYINNTKKISFRCLGYDQNNAVYEVSLSQVDKSIAIGRVLKHYGYSFDDLLAFGDGINDLETLKLANTSVAMANAELELRQAADFITEYTCDEEGVYNFLINYIK